uniref:Uncharacterized protein n=1 Tax=Trichuris muris TaxID=70415 RepID=A0A5S6R551_TRIMR
MAQPTARTKQSRSKTEPENQRHAAALANGLNDDLRLTKLPIFLEGTALLLYEEVTEGRQLKYAEVKEAPLKRFERPEQEKARRISVRLCCTSASTSKARCPISTGGEQQVLRRVQDNLSFSDLVRKAHDMIVSKNYKTNASFTDSVNRGSAVVKEQ